MLNVVPRFPNEGIRHGLDIACGCKDHRMIADLIDMSGTALCDFANGPKGFTVKHLIRITTGSLQMSSHVGFGVVRAQIGQIAAAGNPLIEGRDSSIDESLFECCGARHD